MMWKSVTALIVLFWIAMTALLVQHSYFSEESQLSDVPVNMVQDRAATYQKQAGGSTTLQLLHEKTQAGQVHLSITKREAASGGADAGYLWRMGGQVLGKALGNEQAGGVNWAFDGDLTPDQRWERVRLNVIASQNQTNIIVEWKLGDDMPKIEVMREGKLVMDTKAVMDQAKNQGGGGLGIGGLAAMMPSFMGSQKISLERIVQMQARTDRIAVGERKVRGYSLTMSALGLMQAKARFTESGALAEVELPSHWRLIDLMVLGLESEGGKL